jgi:hypothetical protein
MTLLWRVEESRIITLFSPAAGQEELIADDNKAAVQGDNS